MAVCIELGPLALPPSSQSSQIGNESCWLAIRCPPAALVEDHSEQLKSCILPHQGSHARQLPNRGRFHQHSILFSTNETEVLRVLTKHDDQSTGCCMRMCFQSLYSTSNIKTIRTLPSSASLRCLADSQGKPHGRSRDLMAGGPLQFAPRTLLHVEQGGVTKTASNSPCLMRCSNGCCTAPFERSHSGEF